MTPTCVLCGTVASLPYITGYDYLTGQPGVFTVVQCDQCGLLRLSPRPVDLAPYYPENYEFFVIYEEPYSPLQELVRQHGHKKRTRIVRQIARRETGALLDVGCATGAFLEAMQRQGWAVQGVEPDEKAGTVARERGLLIHNAVLEQANLPNATFDVVTLWDVLEHVPDPRVTLQEVSRVLKPGGAVLIRIPTPTGLDARLFGKYWCGWDMPRHLWLFRQEDLFALLSQTGFDNIGVRRDYGSYQHWRYSAENWVAAHFSGRVVRVVKSLLRNPFVQLITWPFFNLLKGSQLNSVLLVVAYLRMPA